MTHKLVLKVEKFQLFSGKHFGTVEELNPPGGGGPPIPFRVKPTHAWVLAQQCSQWLQRYQCQDKSDQQC